MGRKTRIALIAAAAIAAALIGLRLALPSIAKSRLNAKLDSLDAYRGHVDAVVLSLWRGGIVLGGLSVRSRRTEFRLDVGALDVSVDWKALIHRRITAKIVMDKPVVTLGTAEGGGETAGGEAKKKENKPSHAAKTAKTEAGQTLPETLQAMVPLKINRFLVRDGEVRMPATAGQPEVKISSVQAELDNLTNVRGNSVAHGQASARLQDQGRADLDVNFDPLAEQPTFGLAFTVKDLSLPALNPLLKRQWGVTLEQGTFEMVCEARAAKGRFDGYIKPFARDLKATPPRKARGPIKAVKQAVASAAAALLKNQKTKTVAAKVPFGGGFGDAKVGTWQAVGSVLQNAFIKALSPSFEGLRRNG